MRQGEVADWYELRDCIGSGSMGVVRRARSRRKPEGGTVVAIKTVRTADSDGCSILCPDEIKRLLSEIQITSGCRHPNVIRTLEAFVGNATLDIVMELAKGGEVAATFADASSHSEQKAQGILRQVCAGLAYLHGKGIAHRDVKPENVMYKDQLQQSVVLVDFGFARQNLSACCAQSPQGSRRHTLVGKAPFMAPELFEPWDDLKPRMGDHLVLWYWTSVDIWAVGIFAYFVLFGSLPFAPTGRSLTEFRNGVLTEALQFPEDLAGDFSSAALEFIVGCLNKDANQRLTAAAAGKHKWFLEQASETRLQHFLTWQHNVRRSLAERDLLIGCQAIASGPKVDMAGMMSRPSGDNASDANFGPEADTSEDSEEGKGSTEGLGGAMSVANCTGASSLEHAREERRPDSNSVGSIASTENMDKVASDQFAAASWNRAGTGGSTAELDQFENLYGELLALTRRLECAGVVRPGPTPGGAR